MPAPMKIDPGLIDYCTTDRQRVAVQAVIDHGSVRKAAEQLGVTKNNALQMVDRAKANAARQGWSPEHDMTKTVPEGYHVKGTSTLYGDDGQPKIQWVKSNIDQQRQQELMRQAVAAMAEEVPCARVVEPPKEGARSELLNLYIVTDYHLGALAWGEETGDDWDTEIAERLLVDWFAHAIQASPNAGRAVLANIGDFLHYDGLESITPTSGHVLDADTRFQRVVRATIKVFRSVVEMLLKKYPEVHLIMAEGNHDIASSVWLRELFSAHYADEPRVNVELSPDPYYCVEHGKVSLFFHHGHKKALHSIHQVFAAKFREVFGRTEYSYGHMGHLHHVDVKETPLMIMEQHPTLAGKDSHASRGGYLSQRAAAVITYDSRHGEVGRQVIRPEMVSKNAS